MSKKDSGNVGFAHRKSIEENVQSIRRPSPYEEPIERQRVPSKLETESNRKDTNQTSPPRSKKARAVNKSLVVEKDHRVSNSPLNTKTSNHE